MDRLRRPELLKLDLSIFRQFNFTERVTMQFQAESFNGTNTPHFSNILNLRLYPDGRFRFGF